jgi:hypothetical protein
MPRIRPSPGRADLSSLTREQQLATWLSAAARRRFLWGRFDCAVGFTALWVELVTGVDPARGLRGTYRSRRGARMLCQQAGGLPALVERRMSAMGFAPTPSPAPGDVGVVLLDAGPACAIRTAAGWAVLTQRGVAVIRRPALAAWRL